MKTLRPFVLGFGLAALGATPAWSAAASKVTSDLVVPNKRQETVDKATRLTRPATPVKLPEGMIQPFNPAGFDLRDDEERPNPNPGPNPGPVVPKGPSSDRELLEAMAPRIQPTGSFILGVNPLLTFPGAKRVKVGDVISVTFNDREYDITITAIDRTNFTLRYRGEEITRPIKPTK
jgi:hypothetical protein